MWMNKTEGIVLISLIYRFTLLRIKSGKLPKRKLPQIVIREKIVNPCNT